MNPPHDMLSYGCKLNQQIKICFCDLFLGGWRNKEEKDVECCHEIK